MAVEWEHLVGKALFLTTRSRHSCLGPDLALLASCVAFWTLTAGSQECLGIHHWCLPQVTPRPGGGGTQYTGSFQPLLVFVRQYFTVSLRLVKYSHCFCHGSLDPQRSASSSVVLALSARRSVSAGHPIADSQSGLFESPPSLISSNAHLTHLSKCHP